MNRKKAPGLLLIVSSAIFAAWILLLSGAATSGDADSGEPRVKTVSTRG